MDPRDKVVASLHGGPSDQQKLWVEPDPTWPTPWPGYICLNMKRGMPMHYTHVASGVYEFAGACAEFDHDPEVHIPRCPDCGAKILPGSQAHPEHDRK